MQFFHQIKKVSPRMVRLCARHPDGRPMQNKDIAKAMKIHLALASWIGRENDWSRIDVDLCERYLTACRVVSLWRTLAYWRRTFSTAEQPLTHLKKLPKGQRRRIARSLV